MYEIKLLGLGQAYYDGKVIPGFPGQQHSLLLYYLLLNRRTSHTREQIATLFWGDSPSPIARKNLRNALWRLNQSFQSVGGALEDLISIDGEYLSFAKKRNYQLDVDQFETVAHYSQLPSSQELTMDQVSMLEKAVNLYQADLLEGVYEDWCLFERERLRLAFLNILARLVDHHVNKGNYLSGLEYGQRILTLDPTREKAHRQLMMIHWLAGDQEAALQQYRSCCEILQAELGTKPMLETQYLYETILRSLSAPNGLALNNQENSSRKTTNPTLKEMLQKLRFLEMIIEQTNTELHVLDQMIQQVLEAS
jgi:DNA-binding SARP family transcriptional activator